MYELFLLDSDDGRFPPVETAEELVTLMAQACVLATIGAYREFQSAGPKFGVREISEDGETGPVPDFRALQAEANARVEAWVANVTLKSEKSAPRASGGQ